MNGVSEIIIPVRKVEGEGETSAPEVVMDLLDLHERNLKATTECRASVLNALLGALK